LAGAAAAAKKKASYGCGVETLYSHDINETSCFDPLFKKEEPESLINGSNYPGVWPK